ncbi:uncharacterized protein I303_108056 [Kwoniella dejecticola CBS 10117]|uniref:C2 NT-type domain-containing protein n=1 Tax=Kwoniella dejecticola CBS 10117 TaxID=1296121 RepID=A0A1A5ZWE1_9TREE|nr:uncharacterized protein I303_08047 [Kwoniella dejecticola CBS 10117]OBR82133.1 hypothetical protein I303_08047 [Kwoniella dejecticola CBS 10117]
MATSSLLRPSLGIGTAPNDHSASASSSRSSSFLPPPSASTSRSATPLGFPHSLTSSTQNLPGQETPAPHPHHQHSGLSRLKHMFDNQKYALFETTVIIHELANVPQLSGEFDVKWKFRGKKPRGKELLELTKNGHKPLPKPSLPNLKLQAQNLQASSSTASVGTTSTASSGAYPPTPRSLLNPSSSTAPARPLKSLSLPPAKDTFEKPEKKGSEPTPLKQIITPGSDSPDAEDVYRGPVESPEQMMTEEPEVFEDAEDDEEESRSRSTTHSSQTSASSRSAIPPLINIHRPSMTSTSRPSSSGNSTPTDRLAVPFPKSIPVPVRGGTTPSYSTLIDPVMKRGEPSRSGSMNRTTSFTTTNTAASSTSSSTTNLPQQRPFSLARARSASGPGVGMNNRSSQHSGDGHHSEYSSELRKGTTPTQSLKSHSAKWDYELHHTFRVPLGKPIQPPATPNSGNTGTFPYVRQRPNAPSLPGLGDGPLSESGLRLFIEQLPLSSHAKSASNHPPTSSQDHSPAAAIAKTYAEGKETVSEVVRKESRERTVFGIVDIDLAPFAGKGRMTRRFLLKGSRTNATIKLTVDMRWIGGEERWAAPPMQEGHHVAGVHDFMPDTQDAMRSDLGLVKTPSNSSSGSSLGLDLQRSRTTYSTVSSNYATRNASMTELGRSITLHSYQSYENHLAPSSNRRNLPLDSPKKDLKPLSSIPHSSVQSGRQSPQPTPALDPSIGNTNASGGGTGLLKKLGPSPVILNISKAHDHHKHHTHHLRRHHAHGHGHKHNHSGGISDLPPEIIIEAIFNPHPASVNGPFTYVPKDQVYNEMGMGIALENEKQVLDKVIKQASESSSNSHSNSVGNSKGGTGEHTPDHIDLNDEEPSKTANANGHETKHKLAWRGMRVRAKAEREQKDKEKKEKEKEKRIRANSSGL